jgi:tetratricopeptide (TPR) repeat protein
MGRHIGLGFGRIAIIVAVLVLPVIVRAKTAPQAQLPAAPRQPSENDPAALLAQKRYADAATVAAEELKRDPKDVTLWLIYGDACEGYSSQDPEYAFYARDAWKQALTLDANSRSALERLFRFWSDVAELDTSRPYILESLQDIARQLYLLDDHNSAAEVAMESTNVRLWINGQGTKNEADVRADLERMSALMKKYPANADLPTWIATAKLKMAETRLAAELNEAGEVLINEADQTVAAALARSASAEMYYNAAYVMSQRERLAAIASRIAPNQANKQAVLELHTRKQDYYSRALALAKHDDPHYVSMVIEAAHAQPTRTGAQKTLRDALAACPDSQEVRVTLAEELAGTPAYRAEALEILDRPFSRSGLTGPRAYMVRILQNRTLANAANLRLEIAARTTDAKEKAALLEKIEDTINELALKEGDETGRVLRLRGKLLRVQGKNVDAIQTLERARALYEKKLANHEWVDRIEPWEVVDMLARAYIDTNQTGRARDLLTQLIDQFPTYDPARMLLAQLLLREHRIEQARLHVDYLSKALPNDLDVAKLRLQMALDDSKSSGTAYVNMPETTKDELINKIRTAMSINQTVEAMRLIDKAGTLFPGNKQIVDVALDIDHRLGSAEAAKTFVDASWAVYPNDPLLKKLHEKFAAMTPDAIAKARIEYADKMPDAYAAAVTKAKAYEQLNDPAKALESLQSAQKLHPDDTDVDVMLFNFFLWQKQFDQAHTLVDKLTAVNKDEANGNFFRFRLAMAKQDYEFATAYARALTQSRGSFALSWVALGQALAASGQYEEARKSFQSALERQPDNADAYHGAISCCEHLHLAAEVEHLRGEAKRLLPNDRSFEPPPVELPPVPAVPPPASAAAARR